MSVLNCLFHCRRDLAVGAKCSLLACNRDDFLPFTCEHCHLSYCLEHRASHSCPAAATLHVSESAGLAAPAAFGFSCLVCNAPLALPLKCGLCDAIVCMAHRDAAAHSCSYLSAVEAARRGATAKQQDAASSALVRGSGASSTAAASAPPADAERRARSDALRRKAALLRLKSRCPPAKGIAPEDAIYLESEDETAKGGGDVAASGPSRPHAHCVSRHSSAGRLLDEVAATHGARNENSGVGGASARRLHLCVRRAGGGSGESAGCIRLDPDLLLRQAIDAAQLQSGDTVVLVRGWPDDGAV